MNDLVDTMNDALRAAVERAGPQVHFIDYDEYVGLTRGRYCQPKQDESAGKGANLPYAFFYQIKTVDLPWTTKDEKWDHDELKRRQSDDDPDGLPVNNGTLNALYGAMIQQALRDEQEDSGEFAALEDDNADLDLQAEVDEAEDEFEKSIRDLSTRNPRASQRSPLARQHSSIRISPRSSANRFWNSSEALNGPFNSSTKSVSKYPLGSKVPSNNNASPMGPAAVSLASAPVGNITGNFSTGTVVANDTHVLLTSGISVSRINLKKLIVSDQTSRVFHPTQGGHSLIANMILHQMAADKAERIGELQPRFPRNYPPASGPLLAAFVTRYTFPGIADLRS